MAKVTVIKENKKESVKEIDTPIVVEVNEKSANQVLDTETDEIRFLRNLYRIQNDGAFGTHLNKEINDRIDFLKKK